MSVPSLPLKVHFTDGTFIETSPDRLLEALSLPGVMRAMFAAHDWRTFSHISGLPGEMLPEDSPAIRPDGSIAPPA